MSTVFEQARAVADAVLYTGYLRRPYLASARQRRSHWQFGVLVPPVFACDDEDEYSEVQTECVLEASAENQLRVRLRFLRVQRKQVRGRYDEPAESLDVDGHEIHTCEEAVEHEQDIAFSLEELLRGAREVPVEVDGSVHVEALSDALGRAKGSIVRRCEPLRATLLAAAEPIPGVGGGVRLRLNVRNETVVTSPDSDGDQVSRHAMVAAHLLLDVENGAFVSQVEPPEWARSVVEQCRNIRCWPVLLGSTGRSDAVLSAPVILNDNPRAEPSAIHPGDLADDLDEVSALCTMRVSLEQRWEQPETFDRVSVLIDDLAGMPLDVLERLHGAVHNLQTTIPTRRQSQEQLKIPWWSEDSQ